MLSVMWVLGAGLYRDHTDAQLGTGPDNDLQAVYQSAFIALVPGCESKTPDWYAEKVKAKEGQDELRKRLRSYSTRGDHHRQQTHFSSLSDNEKSTQAGLAVTCYTEARWAAETLLNAGIER